MKRLFILAAIILAVISCQKQQDSFEYILKGEVIGKDSGKIGYHTSDRKGDVVFISFENGNFEHKDTSLEIYRTSIFFFEDYKDRNMTVFPVIIEPGEINLKIHADSIAHKSKVLSGKRNLQVQKVYDKQIDYWTSLNFNRVKTKEKRDSLLNVYADSIFCLIKQNKNNFAGVYLLKSAYPLYNEKERKELFSLFDKPEIRQLRDFKTVYSTWLGKKNKINKVGTKAHNFSLPDTSGKIVEFNKVSEGKVTFVRNSSSWCEKGTTNILPLNKIYKTYNDKGFEIIVVVHETKYDRWKEWVQKGDFPWINVLEVVNGNSNEVFYGDMLFTHGKNYLVNKQGKVIANDLSPTQLEEELMKRFEPEKYGNYETNKWNFPEGIHILDKNNAIESLSELSKKMGENPFFIDCWATWCSPCLQQFQVL